MGYFCSCLRDWSGLLEDFWFAQDCRHSRRLWQCLGPQFPSVLGIYRSDHYLSNALNVGRA